MNDAEALDRAPLPALSAADRDAYLGAVSAARSEWSTVDVPADAFVAWVVERASASEGPLAQAIAGLRISDLYIACACALGLPAGLTAFEAAFFGEVDAAAKRVQRSAVRADELRQLVRERLFVGGERAPRIVEYRGVGALRAWLRVTATRMALNLATRGPRETTHDADALADVAAEGDSAEVRLLKAKYGADLRAAFVEGVRFIDAEDKAALLHTYVDGHSIDRLAAMYGIHRATAARRVERARRALLDATTKALSTRLGGCSPSEAKSIMNLAQSQFDVTLGSLLRGERGPSSGSD